MKTFKIISVIASLLFSIAIASAQNTKNKNTEKTEGAKTNQPLIIEFKEVMY